MKRRVLACLLAGALVLPSAVTAARRRTPGAPAPAPPIPASMPAQPVSARSNVAMHVSISPTPARLGQRLHYRATVQSPTQQTKVRFEPPQSGGAFSWGAAHTGTRQHGSGSRSTVFDSQEAVLEADVQVFETGQVTIPGPRFMLDPMPGTTRASLARLPALTFRVLPTVTPADSDASLRPLHGPFAAPWWERLDLRVVAGVALLLSLIAWAIVAARRRRRRPVVAPPVMPVPVRVDPATAALDALAALRRERLPEQGRFGEHALALTRILRRFLEATAATPRPGDTSEELLLRLRGAHATGSGRLSDDDVARLEGLLGLWDRVKFARAPLGVTEAHHTEEAVEAWVRRSRARDAAPTPAASVMGAPPPEAA